MSHTPKDISEFLGNWVLTRTIHDRLSGNTGQLHGVVAFEPDDNGLTYKEKGELTFPDQPPLTASQTYLWRRKPAAGAEVLFHDGRPFHTISFDRTMPEADHICPPDFYNVTYDFSQWPRWSSIWRVRGPRKNYRMESHYTRPQT